MPTYDRIRLGTAPDSWGVWFPDDPNQVPWQQFLDEVVESGYEWIELGPYGYLPTVPARLTDELGRRGLRLSGGAVFAGLISVEALVPYAIERAWPRITGNYALLFAGLALVFTLIQNPDGVAGATYRKRQLRLRQRQASGPQPEAVAAGRGQS